MCGVCGTTGVLILAGQGKEYQGANNESGGLVPQVTSENQVVVKGPDYTGPRETVVDKTKPNTWPAWITAVGGFPTDSGAPGGTFQAQPLPDINVSGRSWWWVPLLLLAGLVVVAKMRRS